MTLQLLDRRRWMWNATVLLLLQGYLHADTITIRDAQLRWVDDVRVSSRDAGVVQKILVKPNDEVTSSTLLLELDNDIQKQQVIAAQKQLAIAEEESTNDINVRFATKSAQVASKELERARSAAAKYAGAVSQSELEKHQLELEQAVLSGEQAKHVLKVNQLNTELRQSEYDLAKIKLGQRIIHSPIDGQVAEILVQVGEWIDLGAPVARVVSLEKLRVVGLVPEKHMFSIKKGQPASLSLLLGANVEGKSDGKRRSDAKDDQLVEVIAQGKVSFISPEVNPVNHELLIWVDIDNVDQKLRPGLVGTLRIETDP